MSPRRLASLSVLVAACGGDPAPHPDGIRSGSRLRATFLAGDGEAREFRGVHDRGLETDCQLIGDPPRCLPPISMTRYYRDAACTEPIIAVSSGCLAAPALIGVDEVGGWCAPSRLWERGELIAPPDELFGPDGFGGCELIGPASEFWDYYAAGEEVPFDRFVAGAYVLEGEGRVRQRVFVGDDGSRWPIDLHDTQLDSSCWYDDSLGICVPAFIWQGYFADDTCSERLASWSLPNCAPVPRFVGHTEPDGAGGHTLSLHERGAVFLGPVLYYTNEFSGACYPTESEDLTQYLPGAPVDELAMLDRVVAGLGRVQRYYITSADGLFHPGYGVLDYAPRLACNPTEVAPGAWRCMPEVFHTGYGFFDHDLFEPCNPTEVEPGQWRCLPPLNSVVSTVRTGETFSPSNIYTDAECDHAIELIEVPAGVPLVPALTSRFEEPCGPTTAHLYELGPEIPSGSIYAESGGIPPVCTPQSWDTDELRRYEVGTELTFDAYAELTIVVE